MIEWGRRQVLNFRPVDPPTAELEHWPPPQPAEQVIRVRERQSALVAEANAIDAYYTAQEKLEDAAQGIWDRFFAKKQAWWPHTSWDQRYAIDALEQGLLELEAAKQAFNAVKEDGS